MGRGFETMDSKGNLKRFQTRWTERRRIKKRVAAALLQIRHSATNKPPIQKAISQNPKVLSNDNISELDSCLGEDSQTIYNVKCNPGPETSSMSLGLESTEIHSTSKLDIIRKWAIDNQVTQIALSNLLKVLSEWLPSEKFPKDSRTLLGTLRNIKTIKIDGGDLFHFGIEKYVIKYLKKGGNFDTSDFLHFQNLSNVISITVGIDGLPVSKSSNVQFWPILAYFCENVNNIF